MWTMTFPEFLERKFLAWQNQEGKRKTISDFAAYIGVSHAVVSMWMNGSRTPNQSSLQLLASVLGIEVYDALSLPRPDADLHYLQKHWDDLPPTLRQAWLGELAQIQTADSLPTFLRSESPQKVNRLLHLLLDAIVVSAETIELRFKQ